MQDKLAALGYREITGVKGNFLIHDDEQAKGHEFHYSTYEGDIKHLHTLVRDVLKRNKKVTSMAI